MQWHTYVVIFVRILSFIRILLCMLGSWEWLHQASTGLKPVLKQNELLSVHITQKRPGTRPHLVCGLFKSFGYLQIQLL